MAPSRVARRSRPDHAESAATTASTTISPSPNRRRSSGYVYYDANDDGQRETGETGIGGVTLSIVPVNVVGTRAGTDPGRHQAPTVPIRYRA